MRKISQFVIENQKKRNAQTCQIFILKKDHVAFGATNRRETQKFPQV